MDSLRKSFKRTSSRSFPDDQEVLLMLRGGDEVVFKVDGNSQEPLRHQLPSSHPPHAPPSSSSSSIPMAVNPASKVWRESSREFWKEKSKSDQVDDGSGSPHRGFSFKNNNTAAPSPVPEMGDDPPSPLTREFLQKQRSARGDAMIDVDLDMDDFRKLPTVPPSTSVSRDLRVSFRGPQPDRPITRGHVSSSSSEDEKEDDDRRGLPPKPSGGCDAEVLRCSSNASFQRGSTLLRAKTRSRLLDPVPPLPPAAVAMEDVKKSGRIPKSGMLRSGVLKSGFLAKSQRLDEDDEDPFLDDDVPEDWKHGRLSWLTVFQWVSLVLIITALVCTLAVPKLRGASVMRLSLWKWALVVFVLICGRLVSGWVIRVIVFFIERNFMLRKRVLYFVYGLRTAVQNCLWLGLVIITWYFVLDKKVESQTRNKALPYVTRIFLCLLVATVLRLLKTLLVKVLASSFHVSTYFDRIQEALSNQYIIETLSGPPLVELQHTLDEEERMFAEVQKLQNAGVRIPSDLQAVVMRRSRVFGSGGSSTSPLRKSPQRSKSISSAMSRKDMGRQQEEVITIEQLQKLNPKNVSAWNMKRFMKIVRYGALKTLDEHIATESGEDESATQIRSEYEAKVAAKKIFRNVAKPGSKYIYLEDIMRFMQEDEARKTFSLFEGAEINKRISKKSLKNWMVNAFRERRALALTLNDTKTAVKQLHQMANVVVCIIVIGLWLLIMGVTTTRFFTWLGSQLLLAAFIFGNTLKTTFESIVFLFVMHPFDVGDRCEVDEVQMFVEEMNLMTTIFLRFDNQKITYPNSLLATKPIGNFYRSPDMGDSIDFCVQVATPIEKLAIMRERIIRFMENKKEHWYPSPSVVLRDVDDMNRLRISIWMRHRINFQDMGMRWTRRELVLEEMIRVLRELDIEYRLLPQDVNVRNMPPITSSRLPSTWTNSQLI